MTAPSKTMLVTSALPYANGPIHLGHLVEYIQTDIWVRVQKSLGHDCTYVCADDAHGTAIMLRAEKEGITPEQLIARIRQEHLDDFTGFLVNFDHYSSTHSDANRVQSAELFEKAKAAGHISEKTISQLFDQTKGLFLADRFVKGSCPKCKAPDQYGDNCEVCGATYNADELIDPVSVYSSTTPVKKDSTHLFFELSHFETMLKDWLNSPSLQPQIANKLKEWLEDGLRAWDITRDAPYFGFEIPGYCEKYFYVWLDAPIGYMAAYQEYCQQNGLDHTKAWSQDSDVELIHFIGKDIINFHGLFWPALLNAAGMRSPTNVFAHGFLTINGAKMSKSRGTFIEAARYLEHLKPEYLRYYLASKLTADIEDIDLNLEDFMQKANTDLVGKWVNIASRTAGFIHKHFDGKLAATLEDNPVLPAIEQAYEGIVASYQNRQYAKAMRDIMALADIANQYIAEQAPWQMAKETEKLPQVEQVCSVALNAFYGLSCLLSPVLPELAHNIGELFNRPIQNLAQSTKWMSNHKIEPFKPLLKRIENKQIEKLVDQVSESETNTNQSTQTKPKKTTKQEQQAKSADTSSTSNEITFEDFAKVDLRCAKVMEANNVEGADKLLQLKLDVGELGQKQVFAGIKSAYSAEQLVGKLVVFVANLKPRKMRFGVSEGMVIAAGPGGDQIFLLSPDAGAVPGMEVK